MPQLDRHDDVFVLTLGDDENRFHPDALIEINGLLDEVAAAEGSKALVTAASGKFWSTGLDLDWLGANEDRRAEYVASVQQLFARYLSMPVITVAAVQGHAFGAGAMLTLSHDFRVMRDDRGFWCLPEVDIKIPFTPAMAALVQSRLTPQAAHEAMTTGRRYGGGEAQRAGIVDLVASENEVLPVAQSAAKALADKAGDTLGAIKTGMYAAVLELLNDQDNPLG
ncbi:MAG: enoyl-CoA hydratase-related protein [Micrococcales bacterium]|nr:enoyl-CoA hydratase-related protein [Micrococcales bacterium]